MLYNPRTPLPVMIGIWLLCFGLSFCVGFTIGIIARLTGFVPGYDIPTVLLTVASCTISGILCYQLSSYMQDGY